MTRTVSATLRAIDAAGYAAVTPPRSFGKPARLAWMAIADLVIDQDYQRDIGATGRRNIVRIANAFDWARFSPVIVAPAGANRFAIVDGQHRVTAAKLCGLAKVPCAIIDADRAAQAAAFAGINTAVTAMSPLQLHTARLAAGDAAAVKLVAVLAQAGVVICRYPVPAGSMKVGDTLAAAKLARFYERFGETTLVAALRCITRTRDGHPGLVRAQIVEAFCAVLEAEPAWRDSKKLLAATGQLDLRQAFSDARRRTEGSRAGVTAALVECFSDHFDKAMPEVGA